MNPCNYFLLATSNIMHTVQELQMEIEAAAEEIISDMLHDTVDNFLFCLQGVHELEGSHTEHVFT
jgi:hypothetical protein